MTWAQVNPTNAYRDAIRLLRAPCRTVPKGKSPSIWGFLKSFGSCLCRDKLRVSSSSHLKTEVGEVSANLKAKPLASESSPSGLAVGGVACTRW